MKRTALLVLVTVLVAAAVSAQLVISSFNQNGELTWTNSVSNGTYRVEWAGSPTGSWQPFDTLTNLSSISATSNRVTVKVPTFFRVVWTDGPAIAGTWSYSAFDANSTLVATGRLSLTPVGSVASQKITGTWAIQRAASSPYDIGEQIGAYRLDGQITSNHMILHLNPDTSDDNVDLDGQVSGTNYQGLWIHSGFVGPMASGHFVAVKLEVGN